MNEEKNADIEEVPSTSSIVSNSVWLCVLLCPQCNSISWTFSVLFQKVPTVRVQKIEWFELSTCQLLLISRNENIFYLLSSLFPSHSRLPTSHDLALGMPGVWHEKWTVKHFGTGVTVEDYCEPRQTINAIFVCCLFVRPLIGIYTLTSEFHVTLCANRDESNQWHFSPSKQDVIDLPSWHPSLRCEMTDPLQPKW